MDEIPDDLLEMINNVRTVQHFNVLNEIVDETHVSENWQLSQFWYDEDTIATVVQIHELLLKDISVNNIALISCPSLFTYFKKSFPKHNVTLFEYDERFSKFGDDFIFYDYKNGYDNLNSKLKNSFDIIIADPPFLSDECIEKFADTITFLRTPETKITFCSGNMVENVIEKHLKLAKSKRFEPKHNNNLANGFACYTNYDIDHIFSKIAEK